MAVCPGPLVPLESPESPRSPRQPLLPGPFQGLPFLAAIAALSLPGCLWATRLGNTRLAQHAHLAMPVTTKRCVQGGILRTWLPARRTLHVPGTAALPGDSTGAGPGLSATWTGVRSPRGECGSCRVPRDPPPGPGPRLPTRGALGAQPPLCKEGSSVVTLHRAAWPQGSHTVKCDPRGP